MPLKLQDIREWLIDNKDEFHLMDTEKLPYDNGIYDTYVLLHQFTGYYAHRQECEEALKELEVSLHKNDFQEIIQWTKKYKILGSEKLLLFEIDYFTWEEDVDEDLIKIHEGLYTERQPYNSIYCFCTLFGYLYWNNSIHETVMPKEEQLEILEEVRGVLKKQYHRRKKV